MELCLNLSVSLTGNGFQQQLQLPIHSLIPSISHSAPSHRAKNFAATVLKDPQIATIIKNQKHHSKSYLARKSAIIQVQNSSDFISTLNRFDGILKVQDLNAILRHFGTSNKGQDLSQLFEWMRQTGKINVSSYSTYMQLTGKSLNPFRAIEIYDNIQEVSIKNNTFVCNSVLSCLVRNGKFESSVKLFHQMKNGSLCPDAVTYSTMLTGCIKVKDGYSKAMEFLKELQSNGLCMDGVLYGTLLAVCASHNRLEDAEGFFKEMKNEGHSPNMFHYGSLLNAFVINGDYKKADELIQDMKVAG